MVSVSIVAGGWDPKCSGDDVRPIGSSVEDQEHKLSLPEPGALRAVGARSTTPLRLAGPL
eukprot:364643-Chlamydomonas_euryale.AAC.6